VSDLARRWVRACERPVDQRLIAQPLARLRTAAYRPQCQRARTHVQQRVRRTFRHIRSSLLWQAQEDAEFKQHVRSEAAVNEKGHSTTISPLPLVVLLFLLLLLILLLLPLLLLVQSRILCS
jgi:hypothetical protein